MTSHVTIIAHKNISETPLECLERVRVEQKIAPNVPMTYAGRLDPLASGKLLILVGDECKEKAKYLALDKEYTVEVLFGVKTDTGDAMGLIEHVDATKPDLSKMPSWIKYIGKFDQEYPAYSSKTVISRSDLGKRQLHELARAGELPDEMPTKSVEIFSIKEIGKGEISGQAIAAEAIKNVGKVRGDFRQEQIISGWKKFAEQYGAVHFLALTISVACSSGTYMRSLAERIGNEAGTVTVANSIVRTKIGNF
jgi:tRNA pseudouridine55 synthase